MYQPRQVLDNLIKATLMPTYFDLTGMYASENRWYDAYVFVQSSMSSGASGFHPDIAISSPYRQYDLPSIMAMIDEAAQRHKAATLEAIFLMQEGMESSGKAKDFLLPMEDSLVEVLIHEGQVNPNSLRHYDYVRIDSLSDAQLDAFIRRFTDHGAIEPDDATITDWREHPGQYLYWNGESEMLEKTAPGDTTFPGKREIPVTFIE